MKINELAFGGLNSKLEVYDWHSQDKSWTTYFDIGPDYYDGQGLWTICNIDTKQMAFIGDPGY